MIISTTLSSMLHPVIYPLVCALSLVLLPFQPEQDPLVISGEALSPAKPLHCPVRA